MSEQRTFEASKCLTRLQGKDYLEVKWRLLWLRTEHPEAVVETDLIKHDDSFALFKARVTIPGGGSATGWGSETARDFRDYIEKAETKALGRALAALGFGTQFCEDYDFASQGNGHVVDSPVEPPGRGSAASPTSRPGLPDSGNLATPNQVRAIYSIARDHYAMNESQVEEKCLGSYGCPPAELTKKQASEFIAALQGKSER